MTVFELFLLNIVAALTAFLIDMGTQIKRAWRHADDTQRSLHDAYNELIVEKRECYRLRRRLQDLEESRQYLN